ncbi:HAD family hydrolase [Clostridium cellulovorans]|uniref:HAD family hydrolase n=1 Tax=Clostridium cellulovorans TaxID=1493 RepID=UPI0024181157|nr:HAD hydrolase family protein [Clostridium cellulovorans]
MSLLKALSRYYREKHRLCQRVMFFGDDVNDIELIKECGIGVAMGNAIEKVKNVANYK